MVRRNRRAWATIAITLSMLMGTEAVLPPIAYAREAEELTSLLFDTYGTSDAGEKGDSAVLTLAAAGVAQQSQEIGKFTFGRNGGAEPGPIAKTLPLIKNAGFDFVEEIAPVYSWVDEDGSQIVTININQKNTALWKDVINQKASLWETAKRNFNNVQKKGGPKFKPVFQLQALTKSKNGTTTMGEAAFMAGMMGSVQGQFFIFTGEFSLTGVGGAKAGFQYDKSQGPQINGNVDINFGLTPKIAGGVGLAYIGRFGVYGTGTVETSIRVLPPKDAGWNYARLKATLGLEVIALVFRVWHKDLWNGGPWDLVTPRAGLKTQSEGYDVRPLFVTAADDGVEVIPIYATPTPSEWYGNTHEYVDDPSTPDGEDDDTHEGDAFSDDDMTNELSTPQLGLRLLREDIYPDAQVQVVPVPDGVVMCWLQSDPSSGSNLNSTRLMWSRYYKSIDTWSDPKPVDTGAESRFTADFEPDLFTDRYGDVHVVWLNASKEVPPNAFDLETVTDLLEVRYANLKSYEDDFGPSEVVSPADTTLVQQAEEAEEAALRAQEEEQNAEDRRPSTTGERQDAPDGDPAADMDEDARIVDGQADTTPDGTVSVQAEGP